MYAEEEVVASDIQDPKPKAQNRRRWFSQRYDLLWLGLGTLAVTAIAFLFGLWGAGGHLAPPLDDTFIHFQYARQLAGGHPFEYNTGDPPSSGDSAFIYPFLLVPPYLLGLDGQKSLIYADLLSLVAHLALIFFTYKIGFKLAGRPLALLAAGFVLLDGRLNYIFVSGMETGLFTAALAGFLWLWLRDVEGERFAWLAAAGTVAALLRPEGHVLVSMVCVLTLVYLLQSSRFKVQGSRFRPGYFWLIVPVLVGLIPYAVNIAITGEWQFNTAASKSIWYLPYSPLYENISITAGWAANALKNSYLGLEIGRSPFVLMAAPVAVLGAGMVLRGARYRFFHLLLVLTLIGGIALSLLLPPIQFNRYYMPYDFLFILYFSLGMLYLVNVVAGLVRPGIDGAHEPNLTDSRLLGVVTAAVILLLLPQFVSYFFAVGDSSRDIYYQQMAFSNWIRQNTPPDARIGVNDTGAHKYMSDRYVIDLIGLTNNRLRGAYFGGWGTIFDTLIQMPEAARPDYLLIHPNVFLNGIDESVAQSFLRPVYSLRVQNPIITAGDTETLYEIQWAYALLEAAKTYVARLGQQPLDTLNVGDVGDEKAHNYKISGRLPSFSEPKSILTTSSYEAEGVSMSESGRRHSGWEEFSVRSIPGKSLTLVSRARLKPEGEQTVMVWTNGHQVGLWKSRNERDNAWQEYEFTIPAEQVTGERTTIRIDSTFDPGGPGFTSYRYWVFAPQ
jgi:hypothetical protein